MAYAPPPEDDRARKRREARAARALELGCSSAEVYLQEQLERLRDELAGLEGEARRGKVEAALESKRGFLALCADNHMDYTLDERARAETQLAYLEHILARPIETFVNATPAFYTALRAACPLPTTDWGPAPGAP